MKIIDTLDYCALVLMFQDPRFPKAISSVKFSKPQVDLEGVAGYIETSVEFEVADIELFASLYVNQYSEESRAARLTLRANLVKRS